MPRRGNERPSWHLEKLKSLWDPVGSDIGDTILRALVICELSINAKIVTLPTFASRAELASRRVFCILDGPLARGHAKAAGSTRA